MGLTSDAAQPYALIFVFEVVDGGVKSQILARRIGVLVGQLVLKAVVRCSSA
jgi:hypothetical protein